MAMTRVRLIGEGDVADVCRLTCLEQSVPIVDDPSAPTIVVQGLKIYLKGLPWLILRQNM